MKPEEQRRLLELAAKAAGMNDWRWREASQALAHYNTAMACFYCDHAGDAITWHPADDDGDSRRLQVMFGINLLRTSGGWLAIRYEHFYPRHKLSDFRPEVRGFAPHSADGGKDARMAVLICSAAIGEAMP